MVTKLTLPSKENAVQEKVNEIIDNLGGGYSAGTGIDISNNTISVDNTVAMKTDIPTVNNATLTITQGGTTKGTFTANASSNVTIDLERGGASRNIGEIVQSTIPLTDAGLHLLDGSVIQRGSYADFVDYIADLVSTYSDLFTTEAAWQSAVTTYGVCGKFVYDSVNNTVRLPKRTSEHGDLIKSYSSGTDWYRIYEDGWCEQGGHYTHDNEEKTVTTILLKSFSDTNYNLQITKELGASSASTTDYQFISAYIENSKTTTSFQTRMTSSNRLNGYDWEASGYIDISDYQYTPIYEYLVIATSTKTAIEVDIDEIATDLNGKADTDLSNCTKPHIVETYVNGTSWYRVYSDGWCEQGGTSSNTGRKQIALLKNYANTNYNVLGCCLISTSSGDNGAWFGCDSKATSSFYARFGYGTGNVTSNENYIYVWQASGYIN